MPFPDHCMTKKCASRDKIVIFESIFYVNKAHHSPLSLLSINQRIIARKTEWCNPLYAHQRAQLPMEWAHCKRKHEVKMTETHELNRPVICLRYAARGVGIRGVAHPVKPANGFRLPNPSASTAQTINWASRVRSDSQLASYPIHFLNRIGRRRKPSGASYTTKSSWKEPLRLNNYIVGSFSSRPVGQLLHISL